MKMGQLEQPEPWAETGLELELELEFNCYYLYSNKFNEFVTSRHIFVQKTNYF